MASALAERSSSGVQSVERAIAILKSFSIDKPERGVGELSRELGLHKSTVSRLMTTLERGGLLSRSPESQRYRLGIDLLGLAAHVAGYMDLREVARPYLRRVADECQESVNLVVLDVSERGGQRRAQVVNLEQFVPPTRQVKNIGRVGRRMPPHCTAAGKVLLAYLPPEEREQVLPDVLEAFTPHTVTRRDHLQVELARVRQQGSAIVQEELEEGLNAVAAPIHDHTGSVIAAASIAGPAYRLTPQELPQLAAHLGKVAARISHDMGFTA
ncbi:MAG: IclR family transcriptional regulator [Anaerolineae bacterium]|nr:IclR family transcriptional regulator [Anaerolineae bacterium]